MTMNNIEWKKSKIDYDALNKLNTQQLTRIENGKRTIVINATAAGRSKGGQKSVTTGHISKLGKKWGAINALKGGTTQKVRLMGAKAMKEKASIKILQLDLNGKLIKEWPSIQEAGRNGFNISQISRVCNNKPKAKSHRGYLWRFK
jgi:hypothetical protein